MSDMGAKIKMEAEMDEKNVLDFEGLEAAVNADAEAAGKTNFDTLEQMESALNSEGTARVDAVAVPLPLEPIVLTEPKPEVACSPKKPYTPRSHKRVVFDMEVAKRAILTLRPTTVNASAKICVEQLAPSQMATAYNKSKKILTGLISDGFLEVTGKTLNWLK